MQTQTPQPNNPSPTTIPALPYRHSCGGRNPSLRNTHLTTPQLTPVHFRHPSPFLKQSKPCLKLQNNQKPTPPHHAKSPEIPFRRRSIKTATSSINVQSIFNQRSIKTPPLPRPPRPHRIVPHSCPVLYSLAHIFQDIQEGIEQLEHGTRDRNGTPAPG